MKIHLGQSVMLSLLLVGSALALGPNLVENGDFEKGGQGWHFQLDDFTTTKVADAVDGGAATYNYISGCGHNFGPARPYAGMVCPKCGGFMCGEESGNLYLDNHEFVSIQAGRTGRGVSLHPDLNTAINEGVRIMSEPIKAQRGAAYVFSFDVKVDRSTARGFVECYRYVDDEPQDDSKTTGDADKPVIDRPVVRVYRKPVKVIDPPENRWITVSDQPNEAKLPIVVYAPKERYEFDFMIVKFFCERPGVLWYDNVSLRQLTPSEFRRYQMQLEQYKKRR